MEYQNVACFLKCSNHGQLMGMKDVNVIVKQLIQAVQAINVIDVVTLNPL